MLQGHEPYVKLRTHGYSDIFEDGTHMWRISSADPYHYMIGEFAERIDALKVGCGFDQSLAQSTDQ